MRRLLKLVSHWEWAILVLLVPLLFLGFEAQLLLIAVIVVLTLLRLPALGRLFPRTPFNLNLLVLGLALLISFTAVFDWALSMPKIAGLLLGISLFFAAVAYMRGAGNGVWVVLATFLVGGVGLSAVGLAAGSLLSRFFGQAANPNEVAGILAWVVPLLTAVMVGYSRPLWNGEHWSVRLMPLLLQGMWAIAVVLLLFTRSRGGIASVFVAMLVMLLLGRRWMRGVVPLLVLGGIFAVYTVGPEELLVGGGDLTAQGFGLDSRLEIWSRGLYGLSDFPLTGMSMNGFREVVHVLYPLFSVSAGTDLGHAHNHLLQAGLDLGILGLIAYLALWLGSFGLLWRTLRGTRNPEYRPLVIGLAGSLTAGWFFGILDAIALGARPGILWWLLLALLVFVFAPLRYARYSIGHGVATLEAN